MVTQFVVVRWRIGLGIVCGDFYRFGETLMEVKIDLETLI
jgi:hypothetical protein